MAKKKSTTDKHPPYFGWIIGILVALVFFFVLYFQKTNIKERSIKSAKPKVLSSQKSEPQKQTQKQNVFSPQSLVGIPILTYHYIGNNPNPQDKARDSLEVPPDKFESQMEYLSSNGYTPVSLDTLYAIFNKQTTAPRKPIVLTFDDGYIDFYTTAYPILRRFNFHAVSFIATGLIGGSYYMNWNQIKEIQSSLLVTFEAHTVTHANLVSLSNAAALKQMQDSKNVLSAQTGYPVNFIAYPYGITNSLVQSAAQAAGFLGGLGTWYGKASGIGMNMPRIKVSGFWSIKEFASRL